jgi:hypothetical protein
MILIKKNILLALCGGSQYDCSFNSGSAFCGKISLKERFNAVKPMSKQIAKVKVKVLK